MRRGPVGQRNVETRNDSGWKIGARDGPRLIAYDGSKNVLLLDVPSKYLQVFTGRPYCCYLIYADGPEARFSGAICYASDHLTNLARMRLVQIDPQALGTRTILYTDVYDTAGKAAFSMADAETYYHCADSSRGPASC